MELTVPTGVVELLEGQCEIGRPEQVFHLLTVDPRGFPHVCLLSRTELAATGSQIRAVVRGTTTPDNLTRTGRAALTAVQGSTSHQLKLRVTGLSQHDELVAARFSVTWHRADDLDVALTALTFVPTEELARAEQWERVTALLTNA